MSCPIFVRGVALVAAPVAQPTENNITHTTTQIAHFLPFISFSFLALFPFLNYLRSEG
jgi:hypothetical protein